MQPDSKILSISERREVILKGIKSIPLGHDSFSDLHSEGYAWIDKSKFVSLQVQSASLCDVFLRPGRFGKSLNASMLHCFVSNGIDHEARADMFSGLSILNEKEVCDAHMGKYPVVKLSLHRCSGSTWSKLRNQLANALHLALEYHPSEIVDTILLNSTALCGDLLNRITALPDEVLEESLRTLTTTLKKFHKRKVYVIIDEYDTPFTSAMVTEEDDEKRGHFFANFFSALRYSDTIKKGCLMGVSDIRGAHVALSGLNFFNVYSVMHGAYDDCFGFTKLEVVEFLKKLGLPAATAEDEWSRDSGIKNWYNGYQIGTRRIINPWSFLSYLSAGLEPGSHWVDSMDGICLLKMIRQNLLLQANVVPALKFLLESTNESERSTVHVSELFKPSMIRIQDESSNRVALFDALCCQGYLTTRRIPGEEITRQVWIPNKELRSEWMNVLRGLSGFSNVDTIFDHYSKVISAFESFDEKGIKKILESAFSNLSARITHKEHAYHLFIAGMLSVLGMTKHCKILNETGAGLGFADLLMSFEEAHKTVIVEFKTAKSKVARTSAKIGLTQIFERNYIAQVPGTHNILAIGCAITPDNHIEMESLRLTPYCSRNCGEIVARLHTDWARRLCQDQNQSKRKRILIGCIE